MTPACVEFARRQHYASPCHARVGLILAALILAHTAVCHGQTTIHADVNQVLVPVVVTDKAGHHIMGLRAPDFRIAEDGVPQDIVSLSTSTSANESAVASNGRFLSASRTAGPTGVSNPGAPPSSPKRTYLICIDTLHSTFANFGRVRQALKKFFDREEAGESQYALIALGRQTQVIQDSTRDPSAVLAAITSKNFMKTITDTESAKLSGDVQQFTYFMRDYYCHACACEAFNTTETPGCPVQQARLLGYLTRTGERTRVLDENFYQALQQIVTAIGSMPTTRTILFISDGFNRFPGRELYGVMSGFAPKDRRFGFTETQTTTYREY